MKSVRRYSLFALLLVGGCAQSMAGVNTSPMVNAMSQCGVSLELQTDIKEIQGVRLTSDATLIRVKPENMPQTRRGFIKYQGCWYDKKSDQPGAKPEKVWQGGTQTVEVYWLEPVKEPVTQPASGPSDNGSLYRLIPLPFEQWKRGN